MTDIAENLNEWEATYRSGWLAHFEETGETNFRIYRRVRNETAPAGTAVDLASSRLLLISSAGAYLPATQRPFAAADPLGDYTMRTFASDTPFAELAFAHEHYDQTAVQQDPQVLLPLRHLAEMVAAGEIGELAPNVVSFMGYQPDATRIVQELVPAILGNARDQQANAALLVPA